MRKITSFFLFLIVLASIFSSCDRTGPGNDTDTGTSEGEIIEIDISKYTLIRPEFPSETLLAAVVQMKKDIDSKFGVSIGINDDWVKRGTEPDDAAYEILVGMTNRRQSSEVLSQIEGAAFKIAVVGNKIVIIGTNDAATVDGVKYFMENYITRSESVVIFLPESYTSGQCDMISLVSGRECKYTVIYREGLDNTSGTSNNDRYDYEVQLALDIRERIKKLTSVDARINTDWLKAGESAADKYEILIGDTNRPETAQAKAVIGVADWCIKIIGNKIVICGWNETTTGLAVNAFLTLLDESVTKDSEGNKGISFINFGEMTGTYSEWITDIPEYEGGQLSGCVDANFGELEYYITGTTAAEFKAYRTKLEAAGYQLYFENEAAGNLFATYTGSGTMIHTYYVAYQNTARIITGRLDGEISLPVVKDENYTKITESSITQMTLDYASGNFGMCYVITLEDGSFIIFDGGGSTGNIDHIRLYNLLKKLNKRPDGKIVIAAWILTHEHWDHYMVFYNFCTTYGQQVTVEQFIANTPSKVVSYNSYNPATYMEDGHYKAAAIAVGGFKLVKPHTGQVIKIRNAEVEVLFTQEDLYPKKLYFFNDSTMITRMKIAGQTIMWLGDTCDVASPIVCNMYGSYLKSDMVQVAHHGYNGATREFYELIAPKFAFWPTSEAEFTNQTKGTNKSGYYGVDYFVAHELGVLEIYCASPDNISITLPYEPGSRKAVKIDVPVS
ncbi:MAG: MBL fold metallo-hydrolase [Clostridiales bacterium]|nr:MBL fold metallo-hydrolase [Clostridiales bacterium]